MKNKKKAVSILILIMVGMVCALYFYNELIHMEIPIHSDDAGSATDLRDMIEMGNWRWSYWLSPFNWINAGLYLILGPCEIFLQTFFSVKYFICITMALLLAVYRKEKVEWWIVPVFVFCSMPGCFGTASIQPLKFHVWTIVVPLVCLVYIFFRGNDLHQIQKKDICILAIISLIGIAEKDILIAVNCWLPFLLYWVIYFIQCGVVKKYIKQILLVGMSGLILGKLVFETYVYGGYGASTFVTIGELGENIQVGISGLLSMFNINLIGNDVLQYNTVIAFLRLLFLLMAFAVVGARVKEIRVKKIENVSMVDAIMTISVPVVLVIYLIGGKREDDISIRYAAYVYYALLVLLCRKMCEVVQKDQFELQIKSCRINMVSAFCVVAIIVSADPVTFTREENETDILAETIASNEQLECGRGSFWQAGVVSCLTGYQKEVQAAEWSQDQVVPFLSVWDSYGDGNKKYNFFVVNEEKNFGITEKNLIELFGDYEEKYSVGDNSIFLYDYDIRTAPLVIKADSLNYIGSEHELKVKNECIQVASGEYIQINNLYVTAGKIRLIIDGTFDKDAVQIEQELGAEMIQSARNKCEYEIEVAQLNDAMNIQLNNVSEKNVQIKDIRIERVDNSIELEQASEYKLYLTPGYYVFNVIGNGIRKSEFAFKLDGKIIEPEVIKAGRQKVSYAISIPLEGELEVTFKSSGEIQKIYYQNEIQGYLVNPKKVVYTTDYGIKINKKASLLYGPYAQLESGKYLVDIYGENLAQDNIYFTCDGGTRYDRYTVLQNQEDHFEYEIIADETVNNFEVIITGIGNEEQSTKVNYYVLSEEDENTDPVINLRYLYNDRNIYTSGEKNDKDEQIVLKNGDICFGPYIDLPSGTYQLDLYGDNLQQAEVKITEQDGTVVIDSLKEIAESEQMLRFSFESENDLEKFEVVVTNADQKQVTLQGYNIKSLTLDKNE